VGKKATLAGSVQVLASGTFAPSLEKKYTILTAASLSGTFAGGITTDLAFLKPTLTYTNTDVTLTLCNNTTSGCAGGGGAVGGTGGSLFGFANAAQTRNQNTVATALDGVPQSNRLVSAVLVQTVDGARQAFDALSGEVYGSVHNAQAEEAQFARGAMLGRMRQASYAGAPGELGALGFAGPQLAYASDSATAAQASAYPVKAPYGPSRDLTFWSLGLGGWGHSDGDGNAASLKSRFGGFLSGVDARFGESWRAGFTAGYVRTDLHANDRASSAGIDSVQLGAYATGRLGVFNVRGGGSYSFDDIDASRSIFFPGFTDQTKARLHGNVGQVFGEVGYGMALGNFALEPLAGLAYVHLRNGSFNESGGAAALTGSATHENLGYSSLGLRLASIMPLSNGTVLVPRATVAWQYAFGDVTPSAALAFQGTGTAFSVAGVPVARNSALVEGGFDWRFTPQAKLGVSYLGELAANAQTHAIKGAFTWDF
jgi:outer membrane autotransporter protein